MGVKNFLRFSLVTFTNSFMQTSIGNVLSSPHSFLTYMLHVFFQYSTTMTPFGMRTKIRTWIHLSSHFHILWFAVCTNSNNKFSTRFSGAIEKNVLLELMVRITIIDIGNRNITSTNWRGKRICCRKFSSIFSASHMVEIRTVRWKQVNYTERKAGEIREAD